MRWMNIFLPENVRHLAVARSHSSTAGVELPPALAGGVSRILLWRKLAVGETTSLYMKAVALARVPVPITPIQAMSISMWAGMEGRGDKSCTFSWVHMYSTCAIILQQHRVPGSIKLRRDWCIPQQGVWRWSQIPTKGLESKEEVSLLSGEFATHRLQSNLFFFSK